MRRTRRIDIPALWFAIEGGQTFDGQNGTDFTIRMHVMGAGDIFHAHDIDTKSTGTRVGLNDTTILDTVRFSLEQPALPLALRTQMPQIFKIARASPTDCIEMALEG